VVMDRYVLGRLLGKGNFAKVYHARSIVSGEEVAIKIMDKDHLSKLDVTHHMIIREIDIMRRVRHPHVVHILEVMATKTRIFVVMEFVGGGPLNDCLIHRRIDEASARRVFQQIVCALDYCHSLGVYHRDIKPDNILLDAVGNIKVADFGLSALTDTAQREAQLHTVCGTPMFIAPEVFQRCGYDGAKADVWACGVLLFRLMAGHFPFNHKDTNMYHMIHRCNYRCPRWFSVGLARLVRRMICFEPARRITIPEIKENIWFKDFNEIQCSCS
jgi:serine/threonine protein kinase